MQAIRRDDERLDLVAGNGVDQRRLAGESGALTRDRARPVSDDQHATTVGVAPRGIDLAGQDHEHARADRAGLRQGLAGPVGMRRAETAQAREIVRPESRERLVAARVDDGWHPYA